VILMPMHVFDLQRSGGAVKSLIKKSQEKESRSDKSTGVSVQ